MTLRRHVLIPLAVLVAATSLAGCRTPFGNGTDRITRCVVKEREKFGNKYNDTQYSNACAHWEGLKQLDDEGNYKPPKTTT